LDNDSCRYNSQNNPCDGVGERWGLAGVFLPTCLTIANSVIVQPDEPYIEPSNNIYSSVAPKVNFRIVMIVPMLDNQGNLIGIEDMVVGVFNKLAASTTLKISVGNISAPTVLSNAAGEMLTSDMSVSIMTSWS